MRVSKPRLIEFACDRNLRRFYALLVEARSNYFTANTVVRIGSIPLTLVEVKRLYKWFGRYIAWGEKGKVIAKEKARLREIDLALSSAGYRVD